MRALARRPRRSRNTSAWALTCACLCLVAGCGGSSSSSSRKRTASTSGAVGTTATASTTAARPLHWRRFAHVRGILDLAPLPGTATIRVAAAGRLETLAGRRPRPFSPSYSAPAGLEAYIAPSSGQRVPGGGCRFPRGAVYALRLTDGHGVTMIDSNGHARRFASLHSAGLEDGIAFDFGGRFGHRLLVTTFAKGVGTTVSAIDCRGRVDVLTRHAPHVEGGIAVAPSSFGRYAGELIAPDELTGNVYAISPTGRTSLIGNSGLAHGQDIGTESEGFVPARYADALVSDRGTPHNPHPGDNEILALSRQALQSAGIDAADLLVVNEGGAGTVAITCRSRCRIRHVADGPRKAHVEGHVVFSRAP